VGAAQPNLQIDGLRRAADASAFLPAALPLRLPRLNRRLMNVLMTVVLAASDISALTLSSAFACFVWAFGIIGQPLSLYLHLEPLLVLFPIIYGASGLYPGLSLGAPETLRRLASATSLGYLMLAAVTFAAKVPFAYSRMTFTLAWLASLLSVPLMRWVTLTAARKFEWWGEPTVVIGNGAQIGLTIDLLSDAKSLGYRLVGALCSEPAFHGRSIGGARIFGGYELATSLASAGVETAIVWDGHASHSAALDRTHSSTSLQRQFRHVIILRDEDGLPVEHVRVRSLGSVLGIEFSNELLVPENRFFKRLLDILLGTIFLVLALPIIVICGLMVKLVSRGPILFMQEREGLDGEKIKTWKLRTMYVDAERRLEEFLATRPELCREWQACFKLKNDPRMVCGIGKLLRRFSIDELPQLANVIAGTMSLVGPRPLPDYHLEMFPREFRELRRTVRPGLTGLWQVMIRSDGDLGEHQHFDSYYIRNWSVWLDFYLLAKTVIAVVGAKGAF
jgi:Undecaprenyl-phosphate galactose phosphotransferase WbaP